MLIQENFSHRITTTWNRTYQKLPHFCQFESAWKVDHRILQKSTTGLDPVIDFSNPVIDF